MIAELVTGDRPLGAARQLGQRHGDDPRLPAAEQRQPALEHEQPIARDLGVGRQEAGAATIAQRQRPRPRSAAPPHASPSSEPCTLGDRQQRAVRAGAPASPRPRWSGGCSAKAPATPWLGLRHAAAGGVTNSRPLRLVGHEHVAARRHDQRLGIQRPAAAVDQRALAEHRQREGRAIPVRWASRARTGGCGRSAAEAGRRRAWHPEMPPKSGSPSAARRRPAAPARRAAAGSALSSGASGTARTSSDAPAAGCGAQPRQASSSSADAGARRRVQQLRPGHASGPPLARRAAASIR